MTTYQRITNWSPLDRYLATIPRLADDELDPFEYRLYGHYLHVSGASDEHACWESVRTTAKKTKMALGKVGDTRDRLANNGWIIVTEHPSYKTLLIQILDRWPENMSRYGQCSPGERIVVDSFSTDQSVLNQIKQQQLNFLSVHQVNTPLDPRLDFLIDRCDLLADISPQDLAAWIDQYGIDVVHERARWYCWARDAKIARSGAWLRSALERGWSQPANFTSDMYLSEEERLARYASGFAEWADG